MRLEGVEGVEPDEESADLKLIQESGNRHEARYVENLKAAGRDLAEIEQHGKDAAAETKAAIDERREVIFQASLSKDDFAGMADFVVLGEPDVDGERRYEVHDTKLAASAKPYHLIQLCCYAEMLQEITGYLPDRIGVILGSGELKPFRTADFFHYYLRIKSAFLELMASFDPAAEPPTPGPSADHGRWQSYADRWLDERDHLVRVAGITSGQIKKLEAAGISSLEGLATTEKSAIPKLSDDAYARLQRQAKAQWRSRLQQEQDGSQIPYFEVIPPPQNDPARGLGMLPPPSDGDVFFDIEGYPLVEGGLEYLLGACYSDGGELKFIDWWAHDEHEEKASFQRFIDWVYERWRADPAMHIYHYAPYEVTAMRKLMGRHATREDQVDDLLRNGVFVDLYRVVRQGILFGDDSYSIKRVEKLYFDGREADVKDAASSIVFYADWMASGDPPDWQSSPLLKKIRDYNEEDCISTGQLATWLRERQAEAGITYHVPTRGSSSPDNKEQQEVNPKLAAEIRRAETAERMLDEVDRAQAEGDDGEEWRIHELLAHLLNFYRREEKPIWWAKFDRLEQTEEELAEDLNCLAGLSRTDTPPISIKKSVGYEFRFDPDQNTKIREGSKVILRENGSVKSMVETFDPEGSLVLKLGPSAIRLLDDDPLPDRVSLIPEEFVPADTMKDSIERLVDRWNTDRSLPSALRQLLLREGTNGDRALRGAEELPLDACRRIGRQLSGGALIIQGPPGTGKTFTGAHMIADLLTAGKSVGVVSNSHKAIINLLRKTAEVKGGGLSGIRVGGDVDEYLAAEAPGIAQGVQSKPAAENFAGGLAAGTAWFFSREEMAGKLDHLFIDEAGQVSLAHVAAMAAATENVVLMGDQMQLGQPIQGSHPGDSGQSILEYALAAHAVVPEHLGVLLDCSYRMHPAVCDFISETVYEGRLHSDPSTADRVLQHPAEHGIAQDSGILFSPVIHDGNSQASDEEVERVLELTSELLQSELTDTNGESRRLTIDDILFVAPYNMQVRRLRDALPDGARVGSVDKFQGQEAPVVIVSLCSSAGEYGSRGLAFILDRNRINVAISRAQTLAVVVADPRIATTEARSINEMQLVNLFCQLSSTT